MNDPQTDVAAAQLDKLKLEVQKIQLEIRNLRRPPIFHPSAYIPILTALIAFSGVMANLYFANQQRDRAVAAQKAAESEATGQELYATGLRKALQENPAPSLRSVNIRFRGSLTREVITALQQDLVANGFVASPPVRNGGISQSSVTYYYPDDKALAEQVFNQATEFFRLRNCPITLQPLTSPAPATGNKPGTIQLDVFHSCESN